MLLKRQTHYLLLIVATVHDLERVTNRSIGPGGLFTGGPSAIILQSL